MEGVGKVWGSGCEWRYVERVDKWMIIVGVGGWCVIMGKGKRVLRKEKMGRE